MPESTIPLLTIMTAPGSLCLAGYISMGGHLYMPLVVFLLILSQCIYGIVVVNLYKIMQVTFYPSYAAFTFPLVISATALVKVKPLFAEKVGLTSLLNILSTFELLLAVAIVSYVFIRYCIFYSKEKITRKSGIKLKKRGSKEVKKLLITGGAGFIGSNLANFYSQQYQVL